MKGVTSNPLGQAADRDAKTLGHSSAAQALTEAELNSLLLLQRREPAPGLGWVGHRWTVEGHGVTPIDLSTKPG